MIPTEQAPRPWLVFADDWGRHPSSCQHLIRHVLPHRPVAWVNTIGTRPPRLDWGTVKRVAGKLRSWFSPRPAGPTDTAPSPAIVSPGMWPSFNSAFARGLNQRLLLRSLRPVMERMPHLPVVVTTLPLVADLLGELPAHRWAYYCVDDFGVWPGYDGATMQRMERDLVPKVDTVIAVSETLQAHVAALGKPSHLLTHGVDLDHWPRTAPTAPPPELARLEPPIILFWGVIDRRMDVGFVKHLSANLHAGSIVFVGPQEDPDPDFRTLPRVAFRPPVPFARLPELAHAATVLVMPYADIPATRAMQPLKLKEYMATGGPVVVRDLPSTREWADAVDVCDSPEAFTAAVKRRIAGGVPESQRVARQRLHAEGWAEKARQFEEWVNGPE